MGGLGPLKICQLFKEKEKFTKCCMYCVKYLEQDVVCWLSKRRRIKVILEFLVLFYKKIHFLFLCAGNNHSTPGGVS